MNWIYKMFGKVTVHSGDRISIDINIMKHKENATLTAYHNMKVVACVDTIVDPPNRREIKKGITEIQKFDEALALLQLEAEQTLEAYKLRDDVQGFYTKRLVEKMEVIPF